MIDYQNTYHTGVLVPSISKAMAELGIEWCEVQDAVMPVWTHRTHEVIEHRIKYTYARKGPHRIELIEGEPGGFWDGRAHPGVHHIGIWAEDIAAQTQHCLDAGWEVELTDQPPEDGYGTFSYVRSPAGCRIELVDGTFKPAFERWWQTGQLSLE